MPLYTVEHKSGIDRIRISLVTGLYTWVYSGELGQATLKTLSGREFYFYAFKAVGIPQEVRRLLMKKKSDADGISYDEAVSFFKNHPVLISKEHITVRPIDTIRMAEKQDRWN